MDPTWKHLFTCIILGATGSRKTFFVKQLLNYDTTSMITPVPNEIIWCYGIWQTAYHEISDKVIFCEGLPDIQNEDNKRRSVIVDDLMSEADKSLTQRGVTTKISALFI